ncbi:MAG: hypothetical protein ACOYM9_20405 [Bradymonadia bacterium]
MVRPLTTDEIGLARYSEFAACILDVKYIRDVEAGIPSALYVDAPETDHHCQSPSTGSTFNCAVRAWARWLHYGGEVSRFELWYEYGAAALFADVAIHGGAGDPTLRRLVAFSFGGLSDFDATDSAAYGRYAAVLATLPDVRARVEWVLSNPVPKELRALLLFNLQDPGVEVLADLYERATEETVNAVTRDELAWLFARVAVARRHPARVGLKPSDRAHPEIAAYIRERDLSSWGAFAQEDIFVSQFMRDEERHARKHAPDTDRFPTLTAPPACVCE